MRKLFVFLLASACFLSCCARFKAVSDVDFENADRFLSEKKYSEAVTAYQKIAKQSAGTEQGANALFYSASVRSFYDNPQKDYVSALEEFDEFLRLYPEHEKARDARNWRYLLKTMLELRKENERLKKSIEELKKLDIRHEERRRK